MKSIVTSAVLALCAASAHANIVQNGDFETGTFAGWTPSGNGLSSDVVSNHATSNASYVWRSGAAVTPAYIAQNLLTQAGGRYNLSFDVFSATTHASAFEVFFNGVLIGGFQDQANNWTHFEFKGLMATGELTELRFGARNNPGWTRLDNVSVLAEANAVPEPGSLALVSAALGLLAFTAPKRRKG